MEWLTELLFVVVLILLNGFFAGAEIAILTARRGRLEQLAKAGKTSARIAIALAGNPGRFLSTVQVGITIVGTLAATYGGSKLVDHVSAFLVKASIAVVADHHEAISLAIVTAFVSLLSLVLGELVPKRAALQRAEQLATFVAFPMFFLSTVARPFVSFLGGLSGLILIVLGVKPDRRPSVAIDDIQHLLEAGTQEGVLEPAEKDVALEALQLGDRRVADIMRPRIDIDAIDINTPSDEVVGAVAMSGFSRLPVYDGSLDRVVGFVYIKDVFQQHYLGRPVELRKILHPPLFVAHSLTLDKLLSMFQEQRTQLAIVLDEFGGTAGMVTFEDILEELVGEIHDEHRRDREQMIVQRDEDTWLLDGRMSVHDVLAAVSPESKRPVGDLDVISLSGIILSQLGRVPRIGDKVAWGGWELEVVDMDGARVDRVLLRRIQRDVPPPNVGEASNT